MCADLLGFILILHRLNQFWSSSNCIWSTLEAQLKSIFVEIMAVSSTKVARVVFSEGLISGVNIFEKS